MTIDYESSATKTSKVIPGVTFRVSRMSFGRRLILLEQVRDLAKRQEFHAAGPELLDRLEALKESLSIDRAYWKWGFESIDGLTIDGLPATAETLWDFGPEALLKEILSSIKDEIDLGDEERKN